MGTGSGGGAREENLTRLSRIEGQVRGIRRMIEEERPCDEVLPQLRSVTRALCRVQDRLLHQHLRQCLRESFAAEDGAQRELKADEVFLLLSRYREL